MICAYVTTYDNGGDDHDVHDDDGTGDDNDKCTKYCRWLN